MWTTEELTKEVYKTYFNIDYGDFSKKKLKNYIRRIEIGFYHYHFSSKRSVILKHLTNDLKSKKYKNSKNKLAGYCYVASEALYHLSGGKAAGLKPMFIRHEGEPHWFLQHNSGAIIDLTFEQFKKLPPYNKAKGKGFLTKQPSKRAKILMKRVKNGRKGKKKVFTNGLK